MAAKSNVVFFSTLDNNIPRCERASPQKELHDSGSCAMDLLHLCEVLLCSCKSFLQQK